MIDVSAIPFTIYNTKTKNQEKIEVKDGKNLNFYACGPTVYDYAHIGNFRTMVIFFGRVRLVREDLVGILNVL